MKKIFIERTTALSSMNVFLSSFYLFKNQVIFYLKPSETKSSLGEKNTS